MLALWRSLLFACSFLAMHSLLQSEIFEVRLTLDCLFCPYCETNVQNILKEVKGVENSKVWSMEGLAVVTWKRDMPFYAAQFFKAFQNTKFPLKEVYVDVEGIVHKNKDSMTFESKPDGSIFYIKNRGLPKVQDIQDGETVRLQGDVTCEQGFNFLCVWDVLPEVLP